jgi:Putative Flp pilus-assembly TadE/G-like
MTAGQRSGRPQGQVLPLFALFLVVLMGFAALAIDVSGAYAARRFYRSTADAGALAGAQDLQVVGSRVVTAVERIRARQHAMDSVTQELGIVGTLPAACSTTTDVDVTDACVLPGTSFHVSIKAGAFSGQVSPIACVTCDPARSVQVGLRNADYQLSFARVLGLSSFNVGVTSVAGLTWSKSYAVVTLRPPEKTGSTYDVKDIKLDGGTHVTVSNGDVATNADMDYTGINTWLKVDDGYGMYFADPFGGPTWVPPPTATRIYEYVGDANYTYPAMRGTLGSAACPSGPSNCAPTFTDARESICGAPTPGVPCTTALLDPTGCGAEATYLQTSVYTFMATQPLDRIFCYQPGIYDPSSSARQLVAAGGDVVVLMPGAYYFKSPNGGLDIGGRLLGGYRSGVPGVALMFDECNNSHCSFTGNSAQTIALNVGNKYPPGTGGTSATAAHDWDDQPVETSGPTSPTPRILMSLLVNKDPTCFVPAFPLQEPAACDANKNKTLNLSGGGSLDVEGVQYAPTDNVEIHGGSTGTGQVGQIWAWTIFYSGGTQINQQGAGSNGPGVLRLDAACTAPGTPCIP